MEEEEEVVETSRYRCGGGWYAGWREASHIGAGRGLRDWSKRSVAGADKKLHPKKVSPSPLRAPDRTGPPVRQPLPRTPLAWQASQTSDIHYSCRPTLLHGGTLKIVRKQIRPTTPFPHIPRSPPNLSSASSPVAVSRDDTRLITVFMQMTRFRIGESRIVRNIAEISDMYICPLNCSICCRERLKISLSRVYKKYE